MVKALKYTMSRGVLAKEDHKRNICIFALSEEYLKYIPYDLFISDNFVKNNFLLILF